MQRGSQGHSIRALRLVGQSTDEGFPSEGVQEDATVETPAAASWIKSKLAGTRGTGGLTFLCLDVEGGTCSWIGAPSADPDVVSAVARFGGQALGESGAGEGRTNAALSYYAPSPMDSTLQPLALNGHSSRRLPFTRRKQINESAHPERFAVMAMTDVPARLLVDRLDALGVPVETVASLWHAAALAWDPGWSPGGAVPSEDPLVAEPVSRIHAAIIVDAGGRLVWSWSRGTELLIAGSMRLRQVSAGEPTSSAARRCVVFGRDEVSRLTAEWLSWSAQTGLVPSRITCVMPEASPESASEFGQALGRSWPGVSVDAALYDDPVGATLRRVAERLEQTPANAAPPNPLESLVGLSNRRGQAHRRLYVWTSLLILVGTGVTGISAWRISQAAARTKAAAQTLDGQWRSLVKEHYPEAVPAIGKSDPEVELGKELDRLDRAVAPPVRTDTVRPILQELEMLSLVVGNSGCHLESVELDGQQVKMFIEGESIQEAADMLEAFQNVSGSVLVDWAYDPKPAPRNPTRVRSMYTAKWPSAKAAKPNESSGTGKPN